MERLSLRLQANSEHVFEDSGGLDRESFTPTCANQAIVREYVGLNTLRLHLCCYSEALDQVSFVCEVTQGMVKSTDRPST